MCRTANGYDINGFGQLKDGRGNICPATIILPNIAMIAKNGLTKENYYDVLKDIIPQNILKIVFNPSNDIEKRFLLLLDFFIGECKEELLERFEWIASQSAECAKFMYENNLMAGYIPEEGIRSALKHGTLAIGQIGLAETLEILIGCDHTTEKGMELAIKIESLIRNRCDEYKNKYKLNFGSYMTPAENLCYTSMTNFKNKYGVVKNVSDKKYFTNSIHVPVYKKVSPFEKIDIESKLTGFSSAGCITYVELDGSIKHNLKALEELILYAKNHDIPYFGINIPIDNCNDCGYTDDFKDEKCPVCNSINITMLRRVTGYLTQHYKTAFNLGKQEETEMRIKHSNIIDVVNGFNVNFNDFVNSINGVAVSVFMNGCPHHCDGCFNSELWEYKDNEMDDNTIKTILSKTKENGIERNLSILGGEPLCPENIKYTLNLINAYKKENTGLVLLWTGYKQNELIDMNNEDINEILNNTDVLIDGPYEKDKRSLNLFLRGSSNQNVIYLK